MTKAVDCWSAKMDAFGKQLTPATTELEQLATIAKGDLPLSIADPLKKRQAELQKQADDLQKAVDTSVLELRADLMLLAPLKKAGPKETKNLPPFLEAAIRQGGVPPGKNIACCRTRIST